ncbi:unnamed protein product [Ceratitis capitata]|uniref:(Mediterranean fruit fly) hypothetical protein n=1 Tax=Ceratitis capitata TaxID=7213 RepID=A0A811UKW3_CERCA|nr:unnamed protein product [Ceratitis capitata]
MDGWLSTVYVVTFVLLTLARACQAFGLWTGGGNSPTGVNASTEEYKVERAGTRTRLVSSDGLHVTLMIMQVKYHLEQDPSGLEWQKIEEVSSTA